MAKVLFSVGGSSGLEWSDFLHICQTCDELGFHGFYPSDHLMQINPGRGTTPARLDGLTVMAAMAGHTRNLRLGMLVINNNFRHPVITAKMVNTIDHVSGGRAELGIGSGNVKHEFDVHGIPFPPFRERADRLDEALSVIKAIWTEEPASFQGTYYSLDEAPQMPKAVAAAASAHHRRGTRPTDDADRCETRHRLQPDRAAGGGEGEPEPDAGGLRRGRP